MFDKDVLRAKFWLYVTISKDNKDMLKRETQLLLVNNDPYARELIETMQHYVENVSPHFEVKIN